MSSTLQDRPAGARTGPRLGFLIRPGWLGAVVGALAFTAACWLVLAPWQFSRNAETTATNNSIAAAQTTPAVPVRTYLSTTAQPAADSVYKQVTATGVFDPAHTFYVRLRQDSDGNPVSEIVLPMRLEDGGVLLVDRGYLSFGDIKAGVQPAPVPTGLVTVTGRVQQDQTDPRNRPPTVGGGRVEAYAVNADALAGMDGTVGGVNREGNILQGYVQLVVTSPAVLTEIGMPQTDSGPYLSYALQWCAFGAMSLLAIGYFVFREATDPRGPDERDAESSLPTVPDGDENALAVSPQAPADPAPQKLRRRSRDGFDKSQLFD